MLDKDNRDGNPVVKKRDVLELHIDDLAFGGMGVAKYQGKIVFVDGGLPGDTARVFIKKIKDNYCEGQADEIIKPSPFRINPVCKHFDICGGCKWQNYEYNMQLKYKAEQLKQNLIHIGKIDNPPVEPIIAARKTYFYRNKMEYSFYYDQSGELVLGLHYAGFFDRVFNIEKCHLQSERSNDIVNYIRNECQRLKLPAYHMRDHKGLLRFLVIRESKFTDEILINLVTGDQYNGYEAGLLELGRNIARMFNQVTSMMWTINSRKANIAKTDMLPPMLKDGVILGRDHIFEKLDPYRFRISADSFFQTNSYQAQLLYDTIIDYADFKKSDIVCDLYCGTGTIAIYISGLVKKVIGIESVGASVEDAKNNARINGVNNVEFIAGKVENIVSEMGTFDKLIIDPPRAGIHPKALDGIIAMRPNVIVYVSCNPSTLARDIEILCRDGYRLERAVSVDMFPQTYHIESVAKLICH